MRLALATLASAILFAIAVAAPGSGGARADGKKVTLIGVAVAASGRGAAVADEEQVTVTNLLRDAVGVADNVEVVSYVVDAAGGAPAVAKHRHYGDEFLYVIKGAALVMLEGAAPVTVHQGEMFHVPYGVVHSAKNASATEPGRVLVFHVKEAGKPVKISAD